MNENTALSDISKANVSIWLNIFYEDENLAKDINPDMYALFIERLRDQPEATECFAIIKFAETFVKNFREAGKLYEPIKSKKRRKLIAHAETLTDEEYYRLCPPAVQSALRIAKDYLSTPLQRIREAQSNSVQIEQQAPPTERQKIKQSHLLYILHQTTSWLNVSTKAEVARVLLQNFDIISAADNPEKSLTSALSKDVPAKKPNFNILPYIEKINSLFPA